MNTHEKRARYRQLVAAKYQVYNSLFMSLPYDQIANIGMLLPILTHLCETGYAAGEGPTEIVKRFFERHTELKTEGEQIDFLFKIIQYVERQVVLFDSIEDAAYPEIAEMSDEVPLVECLRRYKAEGKLPDLRQKLSDFGIRYVFTAHPTQFYPDAVQGIMHDLRSAAREDRISDIDLLLQQLGQTPFLNKNKPSPFEEAISILYYLRDVYFDAVAELLLDIQAELSDSDPFGNPNLIQLGFWPGGDRDGNPFVTADITLEVAKLLRMTVMKCYYGSLKKLRRKLTFRTVDALLEALSDRLYDNMFAIEQDLDYTDILQPLLDARQMVVENHNSIYLNNLDKLITQVKVFKTHFAALDIRQDSRVHARAVAAIVDLYRLAPKPYAELSAAEKRHLMTTVHYRAEANDFTDPVIQDTIRNIQQLGRIQQMNGEAGCNRYIISNSEDELAVLHVFGLFRLCGWKSEDVLFDIVPLFETMTGMAVSDSVMDGLFRFAPYRAHIARRGSRQTMMLGFSDGTKDGGYLKANWEIFNTKEKLTRVCGEHGISALFFDGRGGPPARGGGKTQRFYAAQGRHIANHEIQITIQGQTITSMYGTPEQFRNNCEQLIGAGLANALPAGQPIDYTSRQRTLMGELADISYRKYTELKEHPQFMPYLVHMSTMQYYGKANIGSRPGKRGDKKEPAFSDLRAISFVGAWSQLKQNVPGYFGIGTALAEWKEQGRMAEIQALFRDMPFFKTLLLNSMMSLSKSYFPLTAYMQNDPIFGSFWRILYDEYALSVAMMLEVSGYQELMEEEPLSKASIELRESMVLPLLTIQQFALQQIVGGTEKSDTYQMMVTRSLFGNINASRNSA